MQFNHGEQTNNDTAFERTLLNGEHWRLIGSEWHCTNLEDYSPVGIEFFDSYANVIAVTARRNAMDIFDQAYIGALLFSECDSEGEPLDNNYCISDFDAHSLDSIISDCARFKLENGADIEGELVQAGIDFCFTRNSHGAGFWDGDWSKEVGDRLTVASHAFAEFNAYVGDNGKIYIS